jgi:hypothetical protein
VISLGLPCYLAISECVLNAGRATTPPRLRHSFRKIEAVEVAHVGIERPRTLCQALAVALVGRAGAEEQAPQVGALEAECLMWPSDSTQAAEVGTEHMQTTRPYKC